MNKEIRSNQMEVRLSNPETRTVEGYAIRFNEPSVDMGFTEIVRSEAVTQELLDSSDVFALFNHDPERVLARACKGKGSLKLEKRDDGLYYSFEVANTALGDELLSHIQRGEMNGSSFGFGLAEGDDKWTRNESGMLVRTINNISRLYDVSPVWSPAYPSTSVSCRKLDEINALMDKLDGILKEVQEEANLQ